MTASIDRSADLNSAMGEAFDRMGDDAAILRLATSADVACMPGTGRGLTGIAAR